MHKSLQLLSTYSIRARKWVDNAIEHLGTDNLWLSHSYASTYEGLLPVGITHTKTERGLVPTVSFGIMQPYAAAEVLNVIRDPRYKIVEQGRPDAVLNIKSDFATTLKQTAQATNKLRIWKKAKSLLVFERDVPRSCVGAQPKQRMIHDGLTRCSRPHGEALHLKYFGYEVPKSMPDSFFNTMEFADYDKYEWFSVFTEDVETGTTLWLGTAYAQYAPDDSELYWIGTVLNTETPLSVRYSIGNVLLMYMIDTCVDQSITKFNLGLDVFKYKADMWGTTTQWAKGLEYSEV